MSNTVQATSEKQICPDCGTQLRADARFCGNCGTRLQIEDDLEASALVGDTLAGAYRIKGVIGTGSMGVVYNAEQIALGREVALKVISGKTDDETTRARFRREARAASQLSHPNVVQVYDYGQLPGGQPYLAMELLHGRTLDAVIEGDFPVALDRVVLVMRDVLSALQAAHDLGILHRDLKPANVFLTALPDGREVAKVLDFGIATAMDGSLTGSKTWAPLTEAGFVCGTPAFMSPEQVQGFPLDQRSDIFSAAGLMYQMLTRQRPFSGKSPVEVGANIVLKPVVPPSHLRPDLEIPKGFDEILAKAMAKSPADRYGTAVDMIAALEDLYDVLFEDDGALPMPATRPLQPVEEPSIDFINYDLIADDTDETDFDEMADTVENQTAFHLPDPSGFRPLPPEAELESADSGLEALSPGASVDIKPVYTPSAKAGVSPRPVVAAPLDGVVGTIPAVSPPPGQGEDDLEETLEAIEVGEPRPAQESQRATAATTLMREQRFGSPAKWLAVVLLVVAAVAVALLVTGVL